SGDYVVVGAFFEDQDASGGATADNAGSAYIFGPAAAITWDGSSSTDWNTAANWSNNLVPGATDNVVIPNVTNDPVISGAFTINDVELQSAPLTVASGGALTLNGILTNSGSVNIRSGGSFLQGASSSITGAGAFNIQRQGGANYNMWSSPITAQSGVPGTSYQYNSAASTQDDSDDQPSDPGWSSFNGTMTPGRGYAGQGGGLATFIGTPNNGDVNYGLYHTGFDNTYTQTSGGTPFNLVGNPYPSAVSAASFLAANTDLAGTIYLWNDNGSINYNRSDYAMWNGTGALGTGGGPVPNGFIGTAQGFMVRATTGGAVANFTNAMRVAGNNTQFHKASSEDSRMWFSVEKDNMRDEVLIGMLLDATEDEDRMYDAVKLKGNSDLSFSTLSANTEYAILAVPPTFEERTIQLNLELELSGTYRFIPNTMENMEGYHVYFVDVQTGLNVLLEEGTPVDVAIEAGEYTNRFYLNFMSASITGINSNQSDELAVYSSLDMLHINNSGAADANAVLELIDITGRTVLSEQINLVSGTNSSSMTGISKGVYLVRISTQGNSVTTKIVKQ
ncbi:T9SS type A sorting domain-containing protein, partial [Flavobacteriales bacterium]|nr:T9SS type A sorting domain-containing protein [Flavobacteriales bacterium]